MVSCSLESNPQLLCSIWSNCRHAQSLRVGGLRVPTGWYSTIVRALPLPPPGDVVTLEIDGLGTPIECCVAWKLAE